MEKTALLIIDVQNGMFLEESPVYNGEKLLHNINQLLSRARTNGMPVIYIQHNAPAGKPLEYGTRGWEIHPEIAPHEKDLIIQKTTPDSFYKTKLDDELKKHEIENLILAGIQTEACVDSTCRRAFSMDYNVTLVSDTHSTWDSEEITAQQIINHHNNVLRWFADVLPASELNWQ